MTLTWRMTFGLIALVASVITTISFIGDEAVTTWGIYAYMAIATLVVATVMTYRVTVLRGWTPRVFLFTWWQWVIGGLFIFLAYRISDLPEPPLWVNTVVRAIVGTATTMLLIVLRYRVSRTEREEARSKGIVSLPELVMGPDKETRS